MPKLGRKEGRNGVRTFKGLAGWQKLGRMEGRSLFRVQHIGITDTAKYTFTSPE